MPAVQSVAQSAKAAEVCRMMQNPCWQMHGELQCVYHPHGNDIKLVENQQSFLYSEMTEWTVCFGLNDEREEQF